MNVQKPEPRVSDGDGKIIDAHSIFFTIQGEGPFAGERAVFLRLAGCNLQCPGCDTEYTQGRNEYMIRDLAEAVHGCAIAHGARNCLVVITGGEPLRQPIGRLCGELLQLGHAIQIESNGVFQPDMHLKSLMIVDEAPITLVISPKSPAVHPVTAELAHCFKYVIDEPTVDPGDGLPVVALEYVTMKKRIARPPQGKKVYVNPYDAKDPQRNLQNLRAAADSAMKFGYTLGVQIHKLIGLD